MQHLYALNPSTCVAEVARRLRLVRTERLFEEVSSPKSCFNLIYGAPRGAARAAALPSAPRAESASGAADRKVVSMRTIRRIRREPAFALRRDSGIFAATRGGGPRPARKR
ncbi:MAG: hypothetical protein AAF322_19385, partial [Pseudomonadota bacterium]